MIVAQVEAVVDRPRRRRGEDRDARQRRDDRGGGRGARPADPRRARRARPGDGRRVRGAAARHRRRGRAARSSILPRATVVTPERPGGPRPRRRRRSSTARTLARAVHAVGARSGRGHRAATATRRPTCSSTATTIDRDRAGSASPTAPRTARAARTRARSRRISRSAIELADAARAARAVAAEAVRDGLRDVGRGAGPVNVLGLGVRRRSPDGSIGAEPFAIIPPPMRFLRMKPGHGDQLLAEGDIDVREDERAPASTSSASSSTRACGPRCPRRRPTAAAEAQMVKAFEDIPRDADRVIFFPRAAGGR